MGIPRSSSSTRLKERGAFAVWEDHEQSCFAHVCMGFLSAHLLNSKEV